MSGMIDMLRQRLYGDGPGDLTIEHLLPEDEMLEGGGLDEMEMGAIYDAENPAIDPSNWNGEFEEGFIGDIQTPEQNNMDLREMAKLALQTKAAKRASMSRDFQKKTAQYNKKGQ